MVHVLIDCCLQEKIYNPYYAYLAQKLCEYKRSHQVRWKVTTLICPVTNAWLVTSLQVTFQYSFWDRFKDLASLTPSQLINFRKLLVHLITSKALSLVVIKVCVGGCMIMHFCRMDVLYAHGKDTNGFRKSILDFFRQVVEFPELEKVGVRFFKKLLRAILCDCSEDTCRCGLFVLLSDENSQKVTSYCC